ncbi:MAG TPA: ATP-binding cassette domain-containing protein, partial [Nitrospirae bacterium]|nr:ATP-binding cassette domain-containing protein [Nitrospirota bacterium]
VIILYALRTIIPMIGQVVTQKNTLSNFFPSYEQVNRIKDSAVEQIQKTGELAFKSLGDSIELKGVCFSYPNKEPVLKNIDATIKKGKMTAFVGESGAGKSTIVDLLIGFNEPDNGIVTMDGIPLFDYDINSFRQRIGYVPQDCILFNTTIRDNLLWSKDDASESDIVEACKLANAHDFIKAMPEGYNTIVGDRGVQLSGGQRQRVALSRAILRKPELLILDEATSSLDSQSEILIQEAIERIAHQTTIVAIAHRLSTIARADWIYVIAGGEVVEQGTYRDLINLNGSFKNMAGSQGLVH